MKDQATRNRAGIVLTACILFNLSIGVLYAWSVLKSRLIAPAADGGYGWTSSQAGLPYSIAQIIKNPPPGYIPATPATIGQTAPSPQSADATGSFNAAYIICAIMMGAMIFANYLLKKDIEKR